MKYLWGLKSVFKTYFLEFVLSIGVVIALFYKLGYMPLSADEPIRALIASDMLFNENYIAPKLNGRFYLNKPPLYNYVILVFFRLFNSFDEWVFRLPSILSLLSFGYVVFQICKQKLNDVRLAWIIAIATITAGNIWIYSAYLGHIDVLFSLVSFLQIYAIYHYADKGLWTKMFAVSYALAVVGFMMKGLPSIVFQGISLVTVLISYKSFKRIWSLSHILSSLVFVLPVLTYFWLYSQQADLSVLFNRIVEESSSRTVTSKSFIESISHLFLFPFQYLLDIFPWGVSVFVFIRKDARHFVWSNRFHKTLILLFLFNVIIYWLSPDYRARYVFMLTPLLLIPSLSACYHIWSNQRFKRAAVVTGMAMVLSPIVMYAITVDIVPINMAAAIVLSAFGAIVICYIAIKTSKPSVYLLVIGLIIARLGYSTYMIPFRVQTGPYLEEKIQGEHVASITKGSDLGMYNSNIALTMNWYIAIGRGESLDTKTADYSFDSYYLVPTDMIKDTTNVDTYYTFVRRYEAKPFSLVKFKHHFPKMLNKKK